MSASPDRMIAPRFTTGRLVATPGALATLKGFSATAISLVRRHVSGDWGELCNEDVQANELALRTGMRLFSSYEVGDGSRAAKVWVITEADRSSTCVLLPEEY